MYNRLIILIRPVGKMIQLNFHSTVILGLHCAKRTQIAHSFLHITRYLCARLYRCCLQDIYDSINPKGNQRASTYMYTGNLQPAFESLKAPRRHAVSVCACY